MAGVSVTEGAHVDLDALVAGGDAFFQRVKTLQDAKQKHDAALENLNLGKDVAAAMAAAQAREAAAIDALAGAKTEAEKIIEAAKLEAATIGTVAKDKADADLAAAQAQVKELDAQVISARKVLQDWSDKTTADANGLLAAANAARVAADKQMADNKQQAKELAALQAQAKLDIENALKTKAALDAKIDAIKMAAS